ncbi:MAG: enoyl-CoA hydratase-related protein [Syntrophobacteraceae bacterium]|jgi:enoyl-CoA hydratase
MAKMEYSIEDRIALIRLDDGKVNAMSWEFFKELNESLDRAQADKAAVLILTARPGVFSAGLDLKLLSTQDLSEKLRFRMAFAKTMLRVLLFPMPTIAAYKGHCVAGGFILSCACDRLMVQDGPFVMQMNEVVNAMMIPSWISLICRSSIPSRWWREVLLMARAFTPREAFERGIPDTLIDESGDVLAAAYEVALELKKVSGPGYATTKKTLFQEEADHVMEIFEKEMVSWLVSN